MKLFKIDRESQCVSFEPIIGLNQSIEYVILDCEFDPTSHDLRAILVMDQHKNVVFSGAGLKSMAVVDLLANKIHKLIYDLTMDQRVLSSSGYTIINLYDLKPIFDVLGFPMGVKKISQMAEPSFKAVDFELGLFRLVDLSAEDLKYCESEFMAHRAMLSTLVNISPFRVNDDSLQVTLEIDHADGDIILEASDSILEDEMSDVNKYLNIINSLGLEAIVTTGGSRHFESRLELYYNGVLIFKYTGRHRRKIQAQIISIKALAKYLKMSVRPYEPDGQLLEPCDWDIEWPEGKPAPNWDQSSQPHADLNHLLNLTGLRAEYDLKVKPGNPIISMSVVVIKTDTGRRLLSYKINSLSKAKAKAKVGKLIMLAINRRMKAVPERNMHSFGSEHLQMTVNMSYLHQSRLMALRSAEFQRLESNTLLGLLEGRRDTYVSANQTDKLRKFNHCIALECYLMLLSTWISNNMMACKIQWANISLKTENRKSVMSRVRRWLIRTPGLNYLPSESVMSLNQGSENSIMIRMIMASRLNNISLSSILN